MLGLGLIVPIISLFTNPSIINNSGIVRSISAYINISESEKLLKFLVFVLVLTYTIKGIIQYYLLIFQAKFSKNLSKNLSLRLYKNYLLQPYSKYLSQNTAILVKNIENEISTFSSTIDYFFLFQTNLVLILAIFSIVFYNEPIIGGFILIFFCLIGSLFFLFTKKKVKIWSLKRQSEQGFRMQFLFEGLNAFKDVKILGREKYFINKFETHNSKLNDILRRVLVLQGIPKIFLEVLLIYGIVIVFGISFFSGKSIFQILPTIALIITASFRVLPAFSGLMSYLQGIKYGIPSIDILEKELINSNRISTQITKISEPFSFNKVIELKDIYFSYEGTSQNAINGVNITINRGDFIGLIGKSGSGKSTLVDIILGLLIPSSGKVLVDNIDINTNNHDWHQNIGYVPQVIYLTDDSIKNNIAFGISDENIDLNALSSAILLAQLDDFIEGLPEGYNTKVGERGVRLSGGQRQRIGIARALYHNPDLLILDEATSSLDSITEESVMKSVNLLSNKKTIIVIAHRLSTVSKCDKLYKIDRGNVISQGKPSELL
jgi:ABC-type multidrug transport system fused ATPase/permease subunit